jgi:ATP-binding cassette subfamily B protein
MTTAQVTAKAKRDKEELVDGVERYGKAFDSRIFGRFVHYVGPYKMLVVIGILGVVVFSLSQVALPWIIKVAIDDYIVPGNLPGLWWIVMLFIANAIVNRVAGVAMDLSMTKAGQGILYDLRAEMFSHLQKLSMSFFNKTEVGRLMSRVLGDVGQLQESLQVAVNFSGELVSLIGISIAMMFISVKLGLLAMSVLPVLAIVLVFWQRRAKKSFIRARQSISDVNGALNENISGVRVVQSMNRQDRNAVLFDEKNKNNFNAVVDVTKISAVLIPVVDILRAVSIGLVIVFGARMVIGDSLQVGALFALILYIQRFFDPLRNITMQYTQLQRSMASGSRIFDLLDTKSDVVDSPMAFDLPKLDGEIELRNVKFGYDPGVEIIKDVNLHIKPGETVAIVGPTGAGKTTLISLIGRFYDVQRGSGAIMVDGHDIRDVTRKSLARQMSMVLQEPFLFSGTVKENIILDHEEVTHEQIVVAATAVGAHDFIMKLEDGYDTELEERGSNLSVGQRQLISFTRAIIADPRILVLDEATANIDTNTEAQLQRALKTLLEGRTAIVIAHRLSTIRSADKIVVLQDGRVAEMGTHDELVDSDGLYAHLNKMNYAALESTRV